MTVILQIVYLCVSGIFVYLEIVYPYVDEFLSSDWDGVQSIFWLTQTAKSEHKPFSFNHLGYSFNHLGYITFCS